MTLFHRIQAARGDRPADLLLTSARIIDVFCGQVVSGSIAIADGIIIGLGDYEAERTVDLQGRFVAPGFIDSHVHIESSLTSVGEFVRAVLPCGTTTVIADPHEIGNVLGAEGIRYMLGAAANQPMNVLFSLPSCVPATRMETAGAELLAADLEPFMGHERIVALAEMMNFPGVIQADPDVLDKIMLSCGRRKPVDGHAPGLSGKALNAYLTAGIASDHECTTAKEAREKLAAGMHIMVREGTGARNLHALLPVIDANTARRMMWCTDDRHPHDLIDQGHIDAIVVEAVRLGLDPILAIQMATLNPADYFRLTDVGAIAPGRRADLFIFSDLSAPVAEAVYSRGRLVAEQRVLLPGIEIPAPLAIPSCMHVRRDAVNFDIAAESQNIRIIELIADQLITGQAIEPALIRDGRAVSDPARDILKLAVIERHKESGRMGLGFIRGFGLKQGALAASVAHDSHNLIVVGVEDKDMKAAVEAVIEMGGGFAATAGGKVRARVPLPIAGLMSELPVTVVRHQLDEIIQTARHMGCGLRDPFMALGFVSLPVIPELKLTDYGLVDGVRFKIVPLFV
jgi:adenine deaminase